ncbi:MAG TPA: hypothetical protein VJL59_21340 [Anaerolineales bacterium]|nr:hypothetical protein [Anaerolineales bacterium]
MFAPILTATLPPTATATPAPTRTSTQIPMPTFASTSTLIPSPTATPTFTPGPAYTGRVVIADYMMWYDPPIFDGTITFDVPSAGPYNSDDPATIQRHLALAQQACLNGLAPHWYGIHDERTTNNIDQLLAMSANTNLQHAVLFLGNILPDADEALLIDSINYLIANWANHPNYLHIDGRPVILFVDMNRPWGNDSEAVRGWERIRAATDPGHTTLWMAEGLFTYYNPLFEGLYVYRLDHRDYPQAWLKQPRWARALRDVEARAGLKLYFADSIAPGFDDTRAANAPIDYRIPAPPFARDRRNGQYYRDTYSVTTDTHGDFMIVKSLNEWIEGTAIEPGLTYGDLYVNLTCELANDYRSHK